MNKNEQMVEAFTKMLSKLRQEKAEFNETIDNRIAALEISYEAFTGDKPPREETDAPRTPTRRPGGRRGMRIDRQGAQKTYAFIKERGEKMTTVKMVARKFNITPEAAGQRLLKLVSDGSVVRVSKGEYLDSTLVKEGRGAGEA